MNRVVIFDFDGTIADTLPLMLDIYHKKAETKGWPVITPTTLIELKRHSFTDAMKWAGVKFWQIPGLLKVGRQYINERADEIDLFDGMHEVLDKVSLKYPTYILSNNSPETIRKVLLKHGLDGRVKVLPRPALFNKANSIKRLVKTNKYFDHEVIMVGDELRDFEACRKTNTKFVGVSWGLQDKDLLIQKGAEIVCETPASLKKVLINS